MTLEELSIEAGKEKLLCGALEICAKLLEESAPGYRGVPAEAALVDLAASIRRSIVTMFGGNA